VQHEMKAKECDLERVKGEAQLLQVLWPHTSPFAHVRFHDVNDNMNVYFAAQSEAQRRRNQEAVKQGRGRDGNRYVHPGREE
jgi:hypothetical protein